MSLDAYLQEGAFLVDNSFMEYLTTCPRKAQYRYENKRQPTSEQAALNFGTVVHKALDYRYIKCLSGQVSTEDEQVIYDTILSPFFDVTPPPDGDHRTLDWAFEIVKHYNKHYLFEPFQLITQPGSDRILSEMTFALPLFEHKLPDGRVIPIIYIGRIDLPVIWDGVFFIIDHKTATTLGSFYFDGQKVSSQYEGYCWAFSQLTKHPIGGFCINGIRTKAPPAKPRNGWDSWWSEGFERHKEYLRPGQLEEWKKNTIALIKEFFFHLSQDYFPLKRKACTMYGKCPYYDVCYLPEASRELVLSSDQFMDATWSPLKQLENK